MARKSFLDDLLDAVRSVCFYLPFWAVPLLATVTAGAVYWAAVNFFGESIQQGDAAFPNIPMIAGALTFLLVFVFGTVGWMDRRRRKVMLAETTTLKKLRDLTWQDFEQLVGEAYREKGYRVSEGSGNAADGGIDLDTRSPEGERVLIQCKHWKSQKVGVPIVREMLGVLTREKADRVVIIATGYFTNEAVAWARGQPIELVDGPALLQRIKTDDLPSGTLLPIDVEPSKVLLPEEKSCPRCGGDLVIRTAKRGPNAGNQFLGCSGYPNCRFAKSL
jgi:restriction system protein